MMVLNGVELMKLGRVEMSTLKISCLMNLLFFFFFFNLDSGCVCRNGEGN